jgi:hypothetical protein
LLINPTLSDLVGGIESVTLSDEEARRRGTQKTVLERRSAPTFDVLIEIQTRDRLLVHPDVAEAVDLMVRGIQLQPEIRYRDEEGVLRVEKSASAPRPQTQGMRRISGNGTASYTGQPGQRSEAVGGEGPLQERIASSAESYNGPLSPVRIYPYGVARNRLSQAAKRLGVPVILVNEPGEAEIMMTLRPYYRKRQRTLVEAEQRRMPIYVLRANTINQIEQSLVEIFNLRSEPAVAQVKTQPDLIANHTSEAIQAVLNGERWVDLPPASAAIRRVQHEMARQAQLISHSYGQEPNRRVRIFRE